LIRNEKRLFLLQHASFSIGEMLLDLCVWNRRARQTAAAAVTSTWWFFEAIFASVEGHLAEPQKLATPPNVNCHCSRIIKHHDNMLAQQLQALNRSIRHTRAAACTPPTEGKLFCNF
jgi:hypothetical protein